MSVQHSICLETFMLGFNQYWPYQPLNTDHINHMEHKIDQFLSQALLLLKVLRTVR